MNARKRLGLKLVRALGLAQAFVYKHIVRDTFWRSADGSSLLVSEMSDRHLNAAIRMLTRKGGPMDKNESVDKLIALLEERDRRET